MYTYNYIPCMLCFTLRYEKTCHIQYMYEESMLYINHCDSINTKWTMTGKQWITIMVTMMKIGDDHDGRHEDNGFDYDKKRDRFKNILV